MKQVSTFISLLFLLLALMIISCEDKNERKYLEFFKVNMHSPDAKATFDSIRSKYELPVYMDYKESDGFGSGTLSFSNGFIEIKTDSDSTFKKASPVELVLNSRLPDSLTYENLDLSGLDVDEPFTMEGWSWSFLSFNDLKILGDRGSGVYVITYDDYDFHKSINDSLQHLTNRRIDSILIFSDKADDLNANWNKIDLDGSPPSVRFVRDSIDRIELIIK